MDNVLLLAFTLVVSLGPVVGEYCTAYSYWGSSYRTFHCSFGCCGPSTDEYCCTGSAGAIVGIVLGGICAVAVITTIICCCVKQHNHRGHIIHQAPTTGTYVSSHTTNANIFVVPTGTQHTHAPTYPVQYNHAYGTPGRPPSFPAPPAYSQVGFPAPPVYNHTEVMQPPTYNQTGVWQPPTYNQPGVVQPPTYNQTGVLQPPNYSQVGPPPPPIYSQAGISSPTYNNNSSSNNNNNNNNDDDEVPRKPPVPTSARR